MKVFVLGGGDILSRERGGSIPGIAFSRYISGLKEVDQIIVCDIDMERAKANYANSELKGNKKISFSQLQFSYSKIDTNGLVKVLKQGDMKPSDIVCNGLYCYRTAAPIAKACVEAGTSCFDVCDARDVAADTLALHSQAKNAGVLLMTGLGSNPTASVMVKYLDDRKFKVKNSSISFFCRWPNPAQLLGTPGEEFATLSLDDNLHALAGDIPEFLGGKIVPFRAGDGEEWVDYPAPVGRVRIFYYGHVEAITLPPYLPEIVNLESKAGFMPDSVMPMYFILVRLGLASEKPLKTGGTEVTPIFVTEDAIRNSGYNVEVPDFPGWYRIVASGIRDGRDIKYTCTWKMGFYGGADARTALDHISNGLSIAVEMFGRGEIKGKGAFGPAGCMDPRDWFKERTRRWPCEYIESVDTKVPKIDDIFLLRALARMQE